MKNNNKNKNMKQSTVPDCSKDFARVLVNPVEYEGRLPCMPATLLPLPSWKVRTFARVEWNVGTGGAGWLVVKPQASASVFGNTTSSCLAYTTAANTSTTASNLTANAANMGQLDPQVPVTIDASTASGFAGRLVAFGTKTFVTTPGLTRGGQLYSYVHPDRASVLGQPVNSVISRMGVNSVNVGSSTMEPFYTTYGGPRFPHDLDLGIFSASSLAPADTAALYDHAIIMTSSEPQTLMTEVVAYWELIKPDGATNNTISHSDPSGSGAANSVVWDFLSRNPSRDPLSKTQGKLMGLIKDAWRSLGHVDIDDVVSRSLKAAGVFARVSQGDYLGAASLAASQEGTRGGRRVHLPKSPQKK